jgi:hypothetical protein
MKLCCQGILSRVVAYRLQTLSKHSGIAVSVERIFSSLEFFNHSIQGGIHEGTNESTGFTVGFSNVCIGVGG